MKDESIREFYKAIELEFDRETVENSNYQNLNTKKCDLVDILLNSIDRDSRRLYDRVVTAESDLISFEIEEAFIKGFKTANKLMIDSIR